MATISASTARQTLPAQLDRVQAGEEIEITRHGQVVAVLVSPHTIRARRAPEAWGRAESLAGQLVAARGKPIRRGGLSAERADQLVEAVRADRAEE